MWGNKYLFSLPPSHPRKHLAWFFCWNFLKNAHPEVQLTRKIIALTPKGFGVILYWKQNSLEKHKSYNEERNMLSIIEYYLHLNLLKKIRRVFFIKKNLVLRRKGRMVPQKVFFTTCLKVYFSLFNVLKIKFVTNDTPDTKSLQWILVLLLW